MKLSIALIFIVPVFLCGQPPTDWGAFNQRLDAKQFAGKKFRLEAAVKVQLIDSTAEAEIWARVDRPNKQMGFFYNMMDKPIRTADWKIFTINGKVDKDAGYLAFGGLYSRKGVFYFDHFRLFIETAKNNMEEVIIPNGDFEADTLSSWNYMQKRNGFAMQVTAVSVYQGKQCVKVDGAAFKKPNTFGNNDSTGKYASVNGIQIYYEEYGTGEPLLLLHGNSESINSFRLQIPELSKYYRVIAVDTRGQGKSAEDGQRYTYDLFATDMNALLDHLQIDSANVLGWSDGGNTGLIMAMQYPQKVKKLVAMGANIFIDNTVVKKWVFKELAKQLQEVQTDSNPGAQNRARLINMLLTEPKHTFAELKAIYCPVLVLAGGKDAIKPGHTKQIAANIPKSTLIIAPKETHYYPTENAASFNKTVLEFLKKE
jgi:pimeloyl-ACP methyl ester carboxylesterase